MSVVSDHRGVWVKICGLTRPEDVDAAIEAGASAVGFVFAISPRQLSLRRAAALRERVPAGVTAVGVFSSAERVIRAVSAVSLDAVQVPYDADLSGLNPSTSVLRTVRVIDREQLTEQLTGLEADAVHLDSHVPGVLGGTGTTAPWDEIALADIRLPWVLSGGLGPANVARGIRRLGPDGVDVSSGVESGTPGIKDHSLIREFIEAARNLD